MIKIGVTGNIASGKSTFTTFFDKKNQENGGRDCSASAKYS